MKPETPNPIERLSVPSPVNSAAEFGFNLKNNPESQLNNSPEKTENKANFAPNSSDVVLTTVIPQPVVDDKTIVQPTTSDDSPAAAADGDLIEKEWVDKAKKIVLETKDNPYKREEDVSKLQIDYLAKRYGRKIGASDK
ncbi:MAG: hypothetical protein WCP03_03600 [Candidatus Saccharibacteria bacterium]